MLNCAVLTFPTNVLLASFAPSVLAGALDCQLQGRYQPLPLYLWYICVAVAKGSSEKLSELVHSDGSGYRSFFSSAVPQGLGLA